MVLTPKAPVVCLSLCERLAHGSRCPRVAGCEHRWGPTSGTSTDGECHGSGVGGVGPRAPRGPPWRLRGASDMFPWSPGGGKRDPPGELRATAAAGPSGAAAASSVTGSCWGHTRPPPHMEQPAALQRAAVPFPCRASPRVCSTGRKGFSPRSRLAQLVTRRSWEHEAGASPRPGTRPGPRQPSAWGRWSPRGPPLSGRPVRCCRVVLLPREAGQRERLWPPLHSRRGARRPPRWPWLAVPRLHS